MSPYEILSVVGVFIGLISSAIIGFFTYKNAKKTTELQEENNQRLNSEKYLDWNMVERFVDGIVQKIDYDNFEPDCIYAPGPRGAIIAELINKRLRKQKPIFVGLSFMEKDKADSMPDYEFFTKIKTRSDICIYIPDNMPIKKTDRILIIRDHSKTGRCFKQVKDNFVKRGYDIEKIRTACISYEKISNALYEDIFCIPDYFCLEISGDIWFPWGKNK